MKTSISFFGLLLLFPLLAASGSLVAQEEALPTFPQDFVGDWSGTLQIYTPTGVAQEVPMQPIWDPGGPPQSKGGGNRLWDPGGTAWTSGFFKPSLDAKIYEPNG